jgi:DNA-directed RNA polymerase subunit RPC12/RpoP
MSKLVVEVPYCRFCKKTFRMLVYSPQDNLSPSDLDNLKIDGITPIKKGDDIRCPHCKEVLDKT